MADVNIIAPLADRALLVRLSRQTYNPYKKDDSVVKTANAVGVGNFNKHLFKDKNCRVMKTNQAFSEIYEFHRKHTSPWVDNGNRMIRTDAVPTYKQEMRNLIAVAETAADDLTAHWDEEVAKDLARIGAINHELAKASDYISKYEIRAKYSADVTFMPLPNEDDFRVGMDAEDIQGLRNAVKEAELASTRYVLEQLIEPLRAAQEKLGTEIGEKGAIFRDSLTANIVDVAERMESVNLSQDPEIAKMIKYVKDLGVMADSRKDELRDNPTIREKAGSKVEKVADALAKKMEGLV